MKRVISLLMVLAMLFSSLALTISVNASKENSNATAENIDYIDALYFDEEPTVDGFITEAEWGSSSFRVEATDCATKDDSEPYNRFLYWVHGDVSDYNSWEYEVWFRWDENYFYIGVKVVDPDVHMLLRGTTNTWDGDAIQMRIDKVGPNAATEGQEFEVNQNYTKPWSSNNIPDFLFGYVQIAGGFSEAWENTSNRGITSFSRNPMGAAKAVIAPAGSSYSSDTQNGITTYEIGIPWAYILNEENDKDGNQITALTYTTYSAGRRGNPTGGIGREFGISMVCLDDGNSTDKNGWYYDAWMAWGSGICGDHQTEGAKTCTGSNSVMLSDVKVTQTSGYTTYNPTSLLDATYTQENVDKPGVFYDYLAGDTDKENPIKYEELTSLTYDTDPDGDRSVWGSDDYKGHVTDIGGEYGNVLDYSNFIGLDKENLTDVQFYVDTRDDTIEYYFPISYTIEFDIRYCKTEIVQEDADSRMFNFFGGSTMVDFCCGYVFNTKRFEIYNSKDKTEIISSYSYDLKKNNWYTWRFQFDNESCTARFWIDDKSTTEDDGDGWGTLIFNTRWRYFYYADREETLFPFMFFNTQPQFDNIKMYNFGSLTAVKEATEETGDHTNGGGGQSSTTTTVTGGGEVEIKTDKITKVDGKWHVPVEVKEEYLNATQLTFSLTYDTTKAKFDSISGLKEGTYKVEETTPGTVTVIITDFTEIKKMKVGDTMFEFILTAIDDNAKVEDLNLKLTDSFVYTVTTGDNMTYIVAFGFMSIAIAGCVLTIRRRKHND